MFPNPSGAFLILDDRLIKTSSETIGIKDAVLGVYNSEGTFHAVCSESGGVLETSQTGVFLFGVDSVELLTFARSSDVKMKVDGQGASSET